MGYVLRKSIEEITGGGPSALGYHTISTAYECPRKAELVALNLHKKRVIDEFSEDHFGALEIGLILHDKLAERIVWGTDHALDSLAALPLPEDLGTKLRGMLIQYDRRWPVERGEDGSFVDLNSRDDEYFPLKYLGVETEVVTDIRGWGGEGSLVRTVRYDAVVAPTRGEKCVYSLEHKSSSRGGDGEVEPYRTSFAVQCALWNANAALVAKHGPMLGVIPDFLVKTMVPRCERYRIREPSMDHQQMALEYLRLREVIWFPESRIGAPKMLHACFGRYNSKCEYMDLCWDGAEGSYETRADKAHNLRGGI